MEHDLLGSMMSNLIKYERYKFVENHCQTIEEMSTKENEKQTLGYYKIETAMHQNKIEKGIEYVTKYFTIKPKEDYIGNKGK